ncbi:ABC transporter permease [Dictyobacter formicarum]|uniref:Sugar ABC transporter permease n=1 Tax=Dictyobacter formicarum TaxID=2778368 RepID=A0ABQ3V7S4_9CHLR|nr:ABC transporter permease [Dictyobacter formicarum]GHO82182.1 sugar ABC transporter permease [Dictyobacter formicarum]
MKADLGNPAVQETSIPPSRRERLKRILAILGSLQGYIGLILIVGFGILSKGSIFWDGVNLTNAIGDFSSRGILAVGETLVILIAGIDLSVGSLLGFCSMTAALLLTTRGLNPIEIILISMIVGATFGFLNGFATSWLRIQSFIVTLAMLSIARGLDRQLSNNVSVGTQTVMANGQLTPNSSAFQLLGTPGHNLFTFTLPFVGQVGIYYPVLAFLVVCIIFQFILSRTRFGRHIYAVGGNPTAARLSGVNVTLITIAVFTLSGMLAGFAGPIDAAYSASADPLAGQSFELDAIAAAVIGGASLVGGKGTIIGTLVGALILTLLDNVMGLNAVSDNWQLVIKGLIVIVAVVLQRPGVFTSVLVYIRPIVTRIRSERRESPESE